MYNVIASATVITMAAIIIVDIFVLSPFFVSILGDTVGFHISFFVYKITLLHFFVHYFFYVHFV